ncbi:MAG: hypothetical protein J4478_00630 [Candidatus Diapherotrites archaeon]|uniref:Roadblock/LAMTOR2 domain-containing protein n=1 Tax=Candidatus Iainarchaeum sp. TaxID=3101447 RepID=A0A7J4JWU1_9ARCH|nr:MAG: hypothetical protein QT12_C0007G0030 [archaeon GW2011_AR21]MBS3057889.1 hypothetical protein [Candidatus Diapherotrites archaeon]HIH21924.1 hypothetical protein [Candidatus Diapherotrites archaeon]HIH33323.1 hypothetical protein [Candidatus Diapherotrites archaeon]
MVLSKVSTVVRKVASKVLDLEQTGLNEQYKMIKEASRNSKFELEVEELSQLIKLLREKHAVDSIVVAYNNGSLLISSNGSDLKEAITGTAMLSYIRSEIPKSESVFIKKSKGWYMLYPFSKKVYIVHAASNLHNVELKAIADDLESFLKKHSD